MGVWGREGRRRSKGGGVGGVGVGVFRSCVALGRIVFFERVEAFGGESLFEVGDAFVARAEAHFGGADDAVPVGERGVFVASKHEAFVIGVRGIERFDEIVDRLQGVEFGGHAFGDGLVILGVDRLIEVDVEGVVVVGGVVGVWGGVVCVDFCRFAAFRLGHDRVGDARQVAKPGGRAILG